MNIQHIFIVHYNKLIERKKYLIDKFNFYNITNYTFIEDYCRDETSQETLDKYFKLKNLNPAQICITISHIEIYKKIINENIKSCLILEDDTILCDDFVNKFNYYVKSIPINYEMVFLNDGCNLHAQNIVENQYWYKSNTTRTCCSYLITKECCEKILKTIVPFTYAIDHELNLQIKLHNLKVYWLEPTIIKDGSTLIYGSSYTYF